MREHPCPTCGMLTEGAISGGWRWAMCERCLSADRVKLGPDALGRRVVADADGDRCTRRFNQAFEFGLALPCPYHDAKDRAP